MSSYTEASTTQPYYTNNGAYGGPPSPYKDPSQQPHAGAYQAENTYQEPSAYQEYSTPEEYGFSPQNPEQPRHEQLPSEVPSTGENHSAISLAPNEISGGNMTNSMTEAYPSPDTTKPGGNTGASMDPHYPTETTRETMTNSMTEAYPSPDTTTPGENPENINTSSDDALYVG